MSLKKQLKNNEIGISLDNIFKLAKLALMKHGADEENADAVANTIMIAERDGSISHGLFRIPGYIKALKSGKVNGRAKPILEKITPVIFRCNGQNGFASLAHQHSIPPLSIAAKKFGIAIVAIQRSHHFAALWPEVESISYSGLVGLTCLSYLPWVAPNGGKTPLFGTNPLAFSWPRPEKDPIVFDMATSSMAMGDVQIAARDGQQVPLGTGLSEFGKPTKNPAEIIKGVLLPFGGHKGSAISMMVELLAGPLIGEAFSYESGKRDNGDGGPAQGGQFIMALSPDILSGHDWENQAKIFFKKFEDIEGSRLPGAQRFANRKNKGVRKVNKILLETVKNLSN